MPSKRTISDTDLNSYALKLAELPMPSGYAEAGKDLIALFGALGHDPFTRKDWDLVLAAYARDTGNVEIPESVKVANTPFERLSKGLTRPKWGYYSTKPAAPKSRDCEHCGCEIAADEAACVCTAAQAEVDAKNTADWKASQAATNPLADGSSAPAAPSATPDEVDGCPLEAALDAMAEDGAVNVEAAEQALTEAHEEEQALAYSTGAPVPAKPVIHDSGSGVAWVPPGLDYESHPLYVEDEGLRRLAVSQTRCFGNFSDRASTCKGCPLAGFCAVASMSGLADIEAALNRETEEALALEAARAESEAKRSARDEPTPAEEKAEETSNETAEAPEAEEAPVNLPEGASLIQPPFESRCSKCTKMVPAWSTAVHLPGEGLVHADCANK
jgi:hypothetical protein